jgi:magnesium-dependent phosphatase 1
MQLSRGVTTPKPRPVPLTPPKSPRGPLARTMSAHGTANGNETRIRASLTPPRRPAILAADLDHTLWTPELYQLWGGAPFRRCAKTGRVEDRNGEHLRLMGHAPVVLEMLAAARLRAELGLSDDEDDEVYDDDPDALLLSDKGWGSTALAYVSRTEHGDWAEDALKTFTFPLITSEDDLPTSPRARRKAERRAARLGGGSRSPIPHLHALASHHEIYPGSKIAHFKRIRERTGIEYSEMLFFDNESWNVREVERLGVVCVYCPQGLTRAAWEEGVRKFAAAAEGAAASAPSSGARRKKK